MKFFTSLAGAAMALAFLAAPSAFAGNAAASAANEGTVTKYYNYYSEGLMQAWTSYSLHETEAASKIVFHENGEVDFYNMIVNFPSDSNPVKGTLSDDGKNITVNFPQHYCNLGDVAYRLERGELLDWTESGEFEYALNETDNYVVYDINEDGTITLEEGYEILVIGKVGDYEDFCGYSDNLEKFTPGPELAQLPEGLETEEWVCKYANNGRFVNVAVTDTEIYIGNFFDMFSDAWIKGEITPEGNVVFHDKQFIGLSTNRFIYLMCGVIDDMGYVVFTEDGLLNFTYDKAAKTITCALTDGLLLFNASLDEVMYVDTLYQPEFYCQGSVEAAAPAAPLFSFFYEDTWSEVEQSQFWFGLSPYDVNGNLMHTERCFYNLYVDGELYPLDPESYSEFGQFDFSKMTDIPFGFEYEPVLGVLGVWRGLALPMCGISSVGVQAFMEVDGVRYYSDKMIYDVETDEVVTGVEKTLAPGAETVSEEWYGIDGRRLSGRGNGISIVKTVDADGNVKVAKRIRR